jgi:hypothetical protein
MSSQARHRLLIDLPLEQVWSKLRPLPAEAHPT